MRGDMDKGTAIMIGMSPGKYKGDEDLPYDGDESEVIEEIDEYPDEDEMGYSDDQFEMADELIRAVKSGNSELVLDAIHGIYNSYN